MAVSVTSANFSTSMNAKIGDSGTNVTNNFALSFTDQLTDSSGNYLFDRVWALTNYSLTTGAGNLDIDLYDLGSIDLGAGAGEDNLGLSHANARIIALGIRNREVSGGGTLRIDQVGAGTTAWTGFGHADLQLDLAQGAFISMYLGESGDTVTDTTDHILRLNAQTNNCTIDVVFYSKQS